ncbi:MAG: PD-(D/E)XK nuclease family protein, partial [Peptococcaceae bacterium]|nr:PD-(D/E)XK nuclease family protein [Peptococcaceae bacterium]
MSIGLILGRAGSGKTEACIEQIRRGLSVATDEEYILLTPEQATFANEKRILATLGNAAGFQVKVLSFRRFVHRVLQETGGGLRPVLDNVGMSLVLRSILERNLEKLAAFGRVWDKSGFIRRLAELITELRVYQVDPDEMLAKIGDLLPESDLSSKISDIHWILREYEMFLSKGWLDLSGELALLCQKLPEWPRFSKACFWLDGFHGFTPAEFGVIRCLLAAGRPVKVTLNLPANTLERELEEDELFYPTWDTASELRDMCRDYGYEMIPPIYMGDPGEGRFAGSPSLARLERALAVREEVADPSGMPGGSGSPGTHGETQGEAHGETSGESQSETPSETPWETQGEIDGWRYGEYAAIRLSGCGDMRQEVERMAVEIVEAARDEGFRYKDMAVLIRRPEVYEGLIHSILPSYGIPYFMDRPKPLRYHPLVVLIREIAAFLRDQWNTGTLMAYMKTGLTGLTDNQGYALENYCLAYGIQRMHWESPRPWSFSPPQQPEREAVDIYMEGLRQKLWRPLVVLRKSIDVADSTEDIVSNVFQHLSALNAKEACNRLAEESVRCGEPEGAQIHQRAWQEVMKLFDQTVTFLGQDEISDADAKMVAAVWESGLDSLEAAAVPPSLDQVTICSMDRSRSPLAIKVWILGANEGVIPANIKDDSLLNTEERAWLAEHRIRLAPDSRRRLFSEEYLAYIALTRASGSLHISYARADIQGAAQAPSVLLERICRVFPGLQIDEADLTAPRWLIKPAIALPFLGLALRNGNQDQEGMYPSEGWNARDSEGLWRYVYHWFGSRQEHKRDLERLKVAFDLAPLGQALSAELAERLFGHTIKTSVTRLEQFQACPFSHFLGYGLALEPREIYDIQPPEIGNFFHDSLEALLKDIKAEGIAM